MSKRDRKNWHRTGWRASVDGGRVIEFTLFLPMYHRIATTRVFRKLPKEPWYYQIGGYDSPHKKAGPYKTHEQAMIACEKVVREDLRAGYRALGGR